VHSFYEFITKYSAPHVFNPWREWSPMDADSAPFSAQARLKRLKHHFDCVPKYLLIGEAPGYQGCHFSGVPFTSEAMILKGVIPRVTVNGRISNREKPWSEPSATIIWRTLRELGIADVTAMWNAFPFHPYKPGNYYSNRTPTNAEQIAGLDALRELITWGSNNWPSFRVIAVGKCAAKSMERIGLRAALVRHPSMGGAKLFSDGMRAISAGEKP
jgi:uracil-DNA glycosylase